MNRRNGHRLLCSDGKVRAAELAESPDTFFSTPARVRIKGKWITGYMSPEEAWDENYTKQYRAYCFHRHDAYGEFLVSSAGFDFLEYMKESGLLVPEKVSSAAVTV